MNEIIRDYRLKEDNENTAIDRALIAADWYKSPVNQAKMRVLLERRNAPAMRDTVIWISLIVLSGVLGALLWTTSWAIVAFAIYGVLYASASDARWHEFSHGTAFKTDWLNNALYEISSFMVCRESTVWKWSHYRHHSDTLVVGRDPEIVAQRPVKLLSIIMIFTAIPGAFKTYQGIAKHCFGTLTDEERLFIPEPEHRKVFIKARIYAAIYLSVIALAVGLGSFLPLMFIGLPTFYGSWLMPIYGLTQHSGLVENQLDHRLNCRTVYMNLLNRFLYLNMGFHIEHHMYPMVPYYNLPKLHKLIKHDCPKPYKSIWHAWKEIIVALIAQRKNVNYFVERELPEGAHASDYRGGDIIYSSAGDSGDSNWIEVAASMPEHEAVIRFDHNNQSYAIYRTGDGELHASDGYCTHGNVHLADGLVIGSLIECPKHNGRFDVKDGSCQRQPVCIPLKTYAVKEDARGRIFLNLAGVEDSVNVRDQGRVYHVVSSSHLTPYIKELVIQPDDGSGTAFRAGDFMQFDIPEFDEIKACEFLLPGHDREQWALDDLLGACATNRQLCKRNYSIAKYEQGTHQLTFNVRIAMPMKGSGHSMGVGSSYVFSLKPGDRISASTPSGSFYLKNTKKEIIYVGGGVGMAPIRAHISELFGAKPTSRKVSYWYGARSKTDLFYQDYFLDLADRYENFSSVVALSEIDDEADWPGFRGYIHEVLDREYLSKHPDPRCVEYYLCGPPPMIEAMDSLLQKYGVPKSAICYDIF